MSKGDSIMGKKLKVLLLNPFSDNVIDANSIEEKVKKNKHLYAEPPLGLLYIYTYAKDRVETAEFEIIDGQALLIEHYLQGMDYCWELLRKKVVEFNPDIIGVGAYFIKSAHLFHSTCDLIKKSLPDVCLVAGGNYATIAPKTAMADKNIDYIIQSEGEFAFVDFVNRFNDGGNVQDIDGIVYRDQNQVVIVNEKKSFIQDLSKIPIPDRSVLPMDLYGNGRNVLDRLYEHGSYKIGQMTISRGCPYNCTFCTSTVFWNRRIRYRDTESVLEEMRILNEDYGVDIISINDDNFLVNKKKAMEVMQGIIDRNLNIKWIAGGGSGVRAFLDDEFLDLAVRSGYCLFNLAFESGSDETLNRIKKPVTVNESIELVAKIRKKYPEIWINGFFIVGFPFETKKDVINTLEFSKKLDLDWCSHYIYQAIPGSELYEECVEKGIIEDVFMQYEENYKEGRIQGIDWNTTWLFEQNYKYNLMVNFVGNRNLRIGNFEQALRDFEYVIGLAPSHALAYRQAALAAEEIDPKLSMDYKLKEIKILEADKVFRRYYEELGIDD